MRFIFSALIGILFFSNLARAEETVAAEVEKLQGEWECIAFEWDGRKTPPGDLPDQVWTFTEMALSVNAPDAPTKASFVVDPKQSPKAFDLFDGGAKEKLRLGIYKFEEDRLIICLRPPSSQEARPTKFKTEPGSKLGLITLQRIKK